MSAYLPALIMAAALGIMSIICYLAAWTFESWTAFLRRLGDKR